LIGLSATFRGDSGIKKLETLLCAHVVHLAAEMKERKMELQVFGKVLNVRDLVIKLAEEKAVEMPVIVFCTEIDEYKELLPECHIFVDSDVGV
jgi:hypothetical protein